MGPGKEYAHCGCGHLGARVRFAVAVAVSGAEEQQFAAVCAHMETLLKFQKSAVILRLIKFSVHVLQFSFKA